MEEATTEKYQTSDDFEINDSVLARRLKSIKTHGLSRKIYKVEFDIFNENLDTVLGQGAYGTVYKSSWPPEVKTPTTNFNKQSAIAIKECICKSPLDRYTTYYEIETLDRLKHTNVIGFHAYALGTRDKSDKIFIIMAHGGIDLKTFITKLDITLNSGDMTAFIANPEYLAYLNIDLFEQGLNGLDYIHRNNDSELHNQLIHRDIKPSNILIEVNKRDDQERIIGVILRFCDFGTCRNIVKNDETAGSESFGIMKGTIATMAPEVIKHNSQSHNHADVVNKDVVNKVYSTKVDIYAFGLVYNFTLTGKLPFVSLNHPWIQKMDSKKIPDLPNGIPKKMVDIYIRMLDENRDKRPSARDIIQQLGTVKREKLLFNESFKKNFRTWRNHHQKYVEPSQKADEFGLRSFSLSSEIHHSSSDFLSLENPSTSTIQTLKDNSNTLDEFIFMLNQNSSNNAYNYSTAFSYTIADDGSCLCFNYDKSFIQNNSVEKSTRLCIKNDGSIYANLTTCNDQDNFIFKIIKQPNISDTLFFYLGNVSYSSPEINFNDLLLNGNGHSLILKGEDKSIAEYHYGQWSQDKFHTNNSIDLHQWQIKDELTDIYIGGYNHSKKLGPGEFYSHSQKEILLNYKFDGDTYNRSNSSYDNNPSNYNIKSESTIFSNFNESRKNLTNTASNISHSSSQKKKDVDNLQEFLISLSKNLNNQSKWEISLVNKALYIGQICEQTGQPDGMGFKIMDNFDIYFGHFSKGHAQGDCLVHLKRQQTKIANEKACKKDSTVIIEISSGQYETINGAMSLAQGHTIVTEGNSKMKLYHYKNGSFLNNSNNSSNIIYPKGTATRIVTVKKEDQRGSAIQKVQNIEMYTGDFNIKGKRHGQGTLYSHGKLLKHGEFKKNDSKGKNGLDINAILRK